ncbi:SsrA-binding protein, partial [Staphylococcus epidermidis]|uniref:SsrA-binding protein n=1 Tax=Staphylococcus epidermidis TaxID=1282 RepID=UPI0016427BC9
HFHKKQIQKLAQRTPQIAYSIIPFNLYLKHPQSKLLLPLPTRKNKYHKPQPLKQKPVKPHIHPPLKPPY